MSNCPNCAAVMTITEVGELRDKRLRCGYCTLEMDIPDSYSETEEHRSEDGRSYFRRTVTRSDGALPIPESLLRHLGTGQLPADIKGVTVTIEQEVRSFIEPGHKLSEDQLREVEKLLQTGAGHGTEGEHGRQARRTSIWASVAVVLLAMILFGQKGLVAAAGGLGLVWGWRAWRGHD